MSERRERVADARGRDHDVSTVQQSRRENAALRRIDDAEGRARLRQGVFDAASDATVPEEQGGLSGGIDADMLESAQTAVAGAEHGFDAPGVRRENGLVRRIGFVDMDAGPCELAVAEPDGNITVQRAAVEHGVERFGRCGLFRAVAGPDADSGEEIGDCRIVSELVGIHDRDIRPGLK